jgi:sulfate transport system permease protein
MSFLDARGCVVRHFKAHTHFAWNAVLRMFKKTKSGSLPGFGLTMGFTLLYLGLVVLIPLSALFLKAGTIDRNELYATITSPRVMAAYRLTFGASLLAALINTFFGALIAWAIVRYRFYGRGCLDAIIDLPFAMPTAVSGIALMAIYAPTGLIGKHLLTFGIKTAISPLGILIALTFIGLPFVVRTLQPALEELDGEAEQASASLGASRWQTFWRIILPSLMPSLLTGFTLAFARALGEYGSVIFVAGNIPMKTEVISLLIVGKLDEADVPGAAAIAVVMLVSTLLILLFVQAIQWWSSRMTGRA